MDDSNERKFQKELNGGLVGLVLLAVLAESDEDLYGYEIAKRLASANDGTSIFKEGTIYPVLRALSAGSLLTSVPSSKGITSMAPTFTSDPLPCEWFPAKSKRADRGHPICGHPVMAHEGSSSPACSATM